MTGSAVCEHHSGFKSDIETLKRDSQDNKDSIAAVCRKLDGIKMWLILLLGSVVTTLVTVIITR